MANRAAGDPQEFNGAAALDNISATEWRACSLSLSTLPCKAALDNISATEWRQKARRRVRLLLLAALDNISATEWRKNSNFFLNTSNLLHSIISVLPNGGLPQEQREQIWDRCTR